MSNDPAVRTEKRIKKRPYSVKPHSEHIDRYECVLCGYIFDESKHGIGFAVVPEGYRCPLCLAGKGYFEKL